MNENHFGKAIQYMYDHIDQPLLLEDIASAVNLSVSSLKRLFERTAHQSPGKLIRRLKLELAFQSLKSKNNSILEIALSTGFEDPSAFSRCFKIAFGYPPREARKQLNILSELEHIHLSEPDFVELIGFSCQSVTQSGTYFEAAPRAFKILKQLLQEDELGDDFSGFFIGIGHDNPHEGTIAVDQVRFTVGVASLNRSLGLEATHIPASYYARFRYQGKPANLGLAYHYIYGKWIESSSYTINKEVPAFQAFERLPDGLQEENVWIHVPLKTDFAK